jgi:hypothetical protein
LRCSTSTKCFRRALSSLSSATRQASVWQPNVLSAVRLDVDLDGLRERLEMQFCVDEKLTQRRTAVRCRRFGQIADRLARKR